MSRKIIPDANEEGYIEITSINTNNVIQVLPRLKRADKFFTRRERAVKALDIILDRFDNFTNFYFQPDPLTKLRQILA